MSKKYYAVKRGRSKGVFYTWSECYKQVKGIRGALYKSFKSEEEAFQYVIGDFINLSKNTRDFSHRRFRTVSEKDDDRYYAYVDGSYYKGRCGFGVAIFYHCELIKAIYGTCCATDADGRNSRQVTAELVATIKAVQWLLNNPDKNMVICYDYDGIEQWAKDYWKSNLPLTQNYKDFMKSYLKRLAFKKVKAHIGIEGNELADKLAKGQIEDLDIPDDKIEQIL